MTCKCGETHGAMTTLWHRAYCRWYDHREAGHRLRAAVWGWVADRLVTVGDALGWPEASR